MSGGWTWTWSSSDEEWSENNEFATRELAIEDARAELGGGHFFVGRRLGGERIVAELARSAVDGSIVVERLGEAAYDMVGEHTEGWPDVTPEEEHKLGERLREVVLAWLTEVGGWPSFFSVDAVERVPADGES